MEFMLVFTFLTMAGLPDEQMLVLENIDSKQQCMDVADETIKQWAVLAEIEMGEVQFIDCLPVGEET